MKLNLATILIFMAVLFVGYGIGMLENYLKYSKKLKRATDLLEEQASQAQVQALAPAPTPVQPAGLHLWITPDQALNLELDGKRVPAPQALTPVQRGLLVTLLTQVHPWLEGSSVAPTPVAAPQPVTSAAPVVRPAPATSAKPATPVAPVVVKSIVGQINDILQAQLAGTPMAEKRIYLGETLGGGVLVNVGSERYDGLDAVPDPEIKALIRRAVETWEKNTK